MQIGFHFEKIHKEEITHTQIVRYAGASGDFNPIHTVVPFGEKAGLGGVIVHGMMIMGFIGQAIDTWCASNDLVKFSTRFQSYNTTRREYYCKWTYCGRNGASLGMSSRGSK